jgi:chemotaxis regulatin CheY-phosphate phosphatase CheZ
MTRDFSFVDVERLYRDCRDLAQYIADARREIAALRPEEIKQSKLPRAGQELDAIVQATESATNTIMESAEEIMSGDASDAEAYKAMVDDACMRIFEACSFQDITGQRIGKVVETIEYVEQRLDALQKAWGPDVIDEPEPEAELDEDKALLNGPALEGEGIGQSDVDAILGDAHDKTEDKKKGQAVDQADIDAMFD